MNYYDVEESFLEIGSKVRFVKSLNCLGKVIKIKKYSNGDTYLYISTWDGIQSYHIDELAEVI